MEAAGARFDQALADLFPEYSRSRLQRWIKEGKATLDGEMKKPKDTVLGGEQVVLIAEATQDSTVKAEPVALNVVHEDDSVIVINKPAGLVVHPAAGNWNGTLQNGLLYTYPDLAAIPRAGIVHRLDKETSGLMVVAKTLEAHRSLVEQLQERSVKREYLALVQGEVIAGGTIEGDIGRHPVDRKRMAVVRTGKPAVTHFRVEQRFQHYTLLRVSLETGRTHQIRVHMAYKKSPLVGDPVYGGRLMIRKDTSAELEQQLRSFKRQALHATQLGFIHPQSGEDVQWSASMPDDMHQLIQTMIRL